MLLSSGGMILLGLSFIFQIIFTSPRVIFISSESSCLSSPPTCAGTRNSPFINLYQALNFIEGNALKTSSTFYIRLQSEIITSGGGPATASKTFFKDIVEGSNLTIIFEKEAALKQSTVIFNAFPFSVYVPRLMIIDSVRFLFLFNLTDGTAPLKVQG